MNRDYPDYPPRGGDSISQQQADSEPYDCHKGKLREFLPIKTNTGWDAKRDFEGYVDVWGVTCDYARATMQRLERNHAYVNEVLASGIHYLMRKRKLTNPVALSHLTVQQKIGLLTELLPPEEELNAPLEIMANLAAILWVDCECQRITVYPERRGWLYPAYTVADRLYCLGNMLRDNLFLLSANFHDYDDSAVPLPESPDVDDD